MSVGSLCDKSFAQKSPVRKERFMYFCYIGSYEEKGALGGFAYGSTVAAPPVILRRQYKHNQIATQFEKEPQ
jgi:hypothetical protein